MTLHVSMGDERQTMAKRLKMVDFKKLASLKGLKNLSLEHLASFKDMISAKMASERLIYSD